MKTLSVGLLTFTLVIASGCADGSRQVVKDQNAKHQDCAGFDAHKVEQIALEEAKAYQGTFSVAGVARDANYLDVRIYFASPEGSGAVQDEFIARMASKYPWLKGSRLLGGFRTWERKDYFADLRFSCAKHPLTAATRVSGGKSPPLHEFGATANSLAKQYDQFNRCLYARRGDGIQITLNFRNIPEEEKVAARTKFADQLCRQAAGKCEWWVGRTIVEPQGTKRLTEELVFRWE